MDVWWLEEKGNSHEGVDEQDMNLSTVHSLYQTIMV
jgi:hypothetical protein